ncbi:MAG: glycosyltransferase [Candidatus Binatia bacterium]|nr:glycosyltransferase [Candidatus Binatia bacterium]MDG2008779.1 glycosyltransferase [Candidatus Binatia bacterium]
MTVDSPAGAVIVPAYLRQPEDVAILAGTLGDLPGSVRRCIVVAQAGPEGLPPLLDLPSDQRLRVVRLPAGVGKWPAFAEGLAHLDGDESWVAVLDADGAFPGHCLESLAARMVSGPFSHVIGTRPPDAIDLRAPGTDGSRLRIHLEAFSNTLALLTLERSTDPAFRNADLQCGLHLFEAGRLRGLEPASWPFYGGELQLFHDSLQAGYTVGFAPIDVAENPVSTYPLEAIVDGLFQLPFLATADASLRERALAETPILYPDWPLDPAMLVADLEPLLSR